MISEMDISRLRERFSLLTWFTSTDAAKCLGIYDAAVRRGFVNELKAGAEGFGLEFLMTRHPFSKAYVWKFRFNPFLKEGFVPEMDELTTVEQFQKEAFENAKNHGWHEQPVPFAQVIALIHSELSEAFEEFRNGMSVRHVYTTNCNPTKPEGIPTELADVVIRVLDFCGAHGIDLAHAMRVKMAYNRTRPHRHGGKKA